MSPLFSIAYLPPVSYLQQIKLADEIILDQYEHFVKQTYRNRCSIYGPNGKQDLIIPVDHYHLFRIPIREVKISNESPWNKIHWKSITAAYRNSPYFEYYEDDFRVFFEKPGDLLFDFNLKLLEMVLKFFKLKIKIVFTDSFEKNPALQHDLRNAFQPKNNFHSIAPYHQVFADRHGFLNDLSCIDYIFNVGPAFSTQ